MTVKIALHGEHAEVISTAILTTVHSLQSKIMAVWNSEQIDF